jgi:hypothetical protein
LAVIIVDELPADAPTSRPMCCSKGASGPSAMGTNLRDRFLLLFDQ